MDFEIVSPLDFSGWDELLLTHRDCTFFHSSPWAHALCDTYGYTPLYFAGFEKKKLLSLLPLMEIRSALTGNKGVALPFTDFCEPIIPSETSGRGLFKNLIDYGVRSGWKYFEIRGGDGFGPENKPSAWYYEHVLPLSGKSEEMYRNFRSSNKRNIQKAIKSGVEVIFSDSPDSMQEFYRLNCLTRKMHGLPPQPYSFFRNIHKHIIAKKHGLLLLARYRGRAIATAMYFHFGRKAIYKYGASDSRYQNLRANNLVMWKAIERYCEDSCELLSFGRTEPVHEGLKKFKESWGAKERIVPYYRYDFQKNDFTATQSQVTGWHTKIFGKMPIPLLRIIGRVLYKHMG